MIDILQTLSLARTALDDPGAIEIGDEGERIYAINRIDDVMAALDTEHPARALRSVAHYLREDLAGPASPDDDDPQNAVFLIQEASVVLEQAAVRLEPRLYQFTVVGYYSDMVHENNHYTSHFWAEDVEHAIEQAKDEVGAEDSETLVIVGVLEGACLLAEGSP